MRTIILLLSTCLSVTYFAMGQQADYVNGSGYKKQVIYNEIAGENAYNQDIKSDLAKILFGRTNYTIEYVYSPSFRDVLALSLTHDTLSGKYIMQLMRVADCATKMADVRWSLSKMSLPDSIQDDKMMTLYDFSALIAEQYYPYRREVEDIVEDILRNMMSFHSEEPPLPAETSVYSIISFSDFRKAVEYRNSHIRYGNFTEKVYDRYRPEPAIREVSEEFALMLYDKMSVLIRDFKAEGKQQLIADGESVTFRCVIGDELWSLNVHEPQNRALEMSDLLNSMITEGDSGQPIDEAKYVKLLNKIKL